MTHAVLLVALVGVPPTAPEPDVPTVSERPNLLGWPVDRGGFHFQLSFGIGGGADTEGVFHAMELGGTFENGLTLALLHTFIQNRGVLRDKNGPDLLGGWMVEAKYPIYFDEIVGKVAVGPGGLHDQSGDGIRAIVGFGWAYGVDFHVPFFNSSGLTVSLQAIHAVVNSRHYFGVGTGLGYTFF